MCNVLHIKNFVPEGSKQIVLTKPPWPSISRMSCRGTKKVIKNLNTTSLQPSLYQFFISHPPTLNARMRNNFVQDLLLPNLPSWSPSNSNFHRHILSENFYLAINTFRVVAPYSDKSIITSSYNQILSLWMVSCSINKTWVRICLSSWATISRHFPTPEKITGWLIQLNLARSHEVQPRYEASLSIA
jgi:hypothetical protein